MRTFVFYSLILIPTFCGNAIHASIITVPPDLSNGDSYRLVFVTSTTRNGTSDSIGTYDSFVTAAADSNLDLPATNWRAIVSTPATDAIDHLSVDSSGGWNTASVPIYRLDGERVVNGFASLFPSSSAGAILENPIRIDENGGNLDTLVFTGSNTSGQESNNNIGLGNSTFMTTVAGNSSQTGSSWISSVFRNKTDNLSFYALSDVLVVGGATSSVPEPSGFVLGLMVVACLGVKLRRSTHCFVAPFTNASRTRHPH